MRRSTIHPLGQLLLELSERCTVRLPTRSNEDIQPPTLRIESREHGSSEDLAKAPLEQVPLDDWMTVTRHDHTHSRIRYGGSRVDDV